MSPPNMAAKKGKSRPRKDLRKPFLQVVLGHRADTAWMAQAACLDDHPDEFFPPAAAKTAETHPSCARCPVRPDCLTYAFTTQQEYGIWGGEGEQTRRRHRPSRGPKKPAGLTELPGPQTEAG